MDYRFRVGTVSSSRPSYLVRLTRERPTALIAPLRYYKPPRAWHFAGGSGASVIGDSLSDALLTADRMVFGKRRP